MEKLVIDANGRITIPSHILEKRGLQSGDELILVEAAEGLLLYQCGSDPVTARWWSGLSDEERRQAQAEAQLYENFSEGERDQMWGMKAESAEAGAKVEEVDSSVE
jgi:AbrB family looped-hinge helix DNA binding protein